MKNRQKKVTFSAKFIFGVLLTSLLSAQLPSAVAASKAQKKQALAIAYSACTGGTLENFAFTFEHRVQFSVEFASEYHLFASGLLDANWPNDLPRISYENLVQGFTIAGALDPRWKSLASTYREIERQVVKNWNSGLTLGQSIKRGFAGPGQRIVGLCVVARSNALKQARKSKLTMKDWTLKAGGNLLPQLHPSAR